MAKLGRFGKFPFRLGGSPSPQAKAFRSLLALEGVGFSVPDDLLGDQSIDGIWHQSLAAGLGALSTFGESAVWQAFPDTVSDLLPEYERILNIAPPIGASEQERRKVVTKQWLGNIESAYPGIRNKLQEIDLRFDVLNTDHEKTVSTMFGKVFGRYDEPPSFGGLGQCSLFPNYSDDYTVAALLDVGSAIAASGLVGAQKAQGEQLLSDSIPAWCDYNVVLAVGFTLDISLLDVTGLT